LLLGSNSASVAHISFRCVAADESAAKTAAAAAVVAAADVVGESGGASIWERITRHKAPVVEPRDSGAFAAALADYAAKLENPHGNGAVLFAVCRGKVCVCVCASKQHCRLVTG
jgi:hypothetical protein